MNDEDYYNQYLNPNLSAGTLKQYKSQLKKLDDLLDNSISNTSQKVIIKTIKEEYMSPNTEASLLNIAIIVFRHDGKNVDKLVVYRDQIKYKIRQHRLSRNLGLEKTLPSYEEIVAYIDNLFETEQYQKFIVNYLTFYLNVRNEDCFIKFETTKKATKKDLTKNYLVVKKDSISYIRNVYKTFESYGVKRLEIVDKKFRKAVKEVFKTHDYLIENKDGAPVPPSAIGSYVFDMTYHKIGEGAYLKINIAYAQKQDDVFDLLRNISKRRGTDFETLLSSYNIQEKELK
tara:strand:+ start:1046 stop:1906 length:861 start_codon:yes stop_codon:yes gene_type:complete